MKHTHIKPKITLYFFRAPRTPSSDEELFQKNEDLYTPLCSGIRVQHDANFLLFQRLYDQTLVEPYVEYSISLDINMELAITASTLLGFPYDFGVCLWGLLPI